MTLLETALAKISQTNDAVVIRTAERFARATAVKSHFYYVKLKLLRDPASAAIAALAPLGDIFDIGCGRGHLPLFLLEGGHATRVRGVDWDEEKIAVAEKAADGLDASFRAVDVRDVVDAHADTVFLIDVLHYVDSAAQDALLDRAADMVRPGGRLLVREATTGRGPRSWLTIVVEWISRAVKFNLGERIRIRNVERDYVPRLEAKGLTCTVSPCWAGTPFANVLLVAERRM